MLETWMVWFGFTMVLFTVDMMLLYYVEEKYDFGKGNHNPNNLTVSRNVVSPKKEKEKDLCNHKWIHKTVRGKSLCEDDKEIHDWCVHYCSKCKRETEAERLR